MSATFNNSRVDSTQRLKNVSVNPNDSRPVAMQRLDPFKGIPRRQTPQTVQIVISNDTGGLVNYSLGDAFGLVNTAGAVKSTGVTTTNQGGIAAFNASTIHALFVTGFKYTVTASPAQFANPISLVDGDLNDQAPKNLLPSVTDAQSDESYNPNIRNVVFSFIWDAYTAFNIAVNDGETVVLTFVIAGIDRKR